jgi:two-component system, NarL family, response regulator YdfI
VIRVLVAAASGVIRAGLESLVQASPALELLGSESDLASLASAVERQQPDVILADLDVQPEALGAELLALSPIVLLVNNPGGSWIAESLRAGVRAILPRDVAVSEIVAAIQAAAAGLIALHPADMNALLPASRAERSTATSEGEALTPRELDVFTMLAEGAGNKTIAWKLGISEHTVKFHVASIMSKLNAASRTEAVTVGIRKGLIML